jgi:hypothetical protein
MARSVGRYRGRPTLRQQWPAVRSGRLYYRWSLRQHVCRWGGVFDEVLGIKYAGNSQEAWTLHYARIGVFRPALSKSSPYRILFHNCNASAFVCMLPPQEGIMKKAAFFASAFFCLAAGSIQHARGASALAMGETRGGPIYSLAKGRGLNTV